MPSKSEKDAYTNKPTTGHEWDGIQELDTPLPRWWLWVLYASIVWSIVYFILYPAIPGISGYTKGVLGYSSRVEVTQKIAAAKAAQGKFLTAIKKSSPEQIRKNDQLLRFALAGGKSAFADNCAPCHSVGGTGNRGGYPSLADDAWIWGGKIAQIEKTILYGIRSDHDDTRTATMPAFGGEDAQLKPNQISDVAEYVLSLTKRSNEAKAVERGGKLFKEHCISCHRKNGAGNKELGAPRLHDQIWLYGGSKNAIVAQITKPKLGVMPAWVDRLDRETIKMLAVYVHALGGGR